MRNIIPMRGRGNTKRGRKLWLMKYDRDTFLIETNFIKEEKKVIDSEKKELLSLVKQKKCRKVPLYKNIHKKRKFSIINYVVGLIFIFFRLIKPTGFFQVGFFL